MQMTHSLMKFEAVEEWHNFTSNTKIPHMKQCRIEIFFKSLVTIVTTYTYITGSIEYLFFSHYTPHEHPGYNSITVGNYKILVQ